MNMNYSKAFITFLSSVGFILIMVAQGFAQSPSLKLQYITPEHGLSSSTVISLMQDNKGFIWIGTYDGLNRYDGVKFALYKNELNEPKSLQCDQIRDIYEDENNRLFIATNCGLSMYDPQHDGFTNFMVADSSALNGLACNVYHMEGDGQGNLWLATNIGLILFNYQDNSYELFSHQPGKPGSLVNNWVEYIYTDSKGRIWVSTRGGLEYFNPETKSFRLITECSDPTIDLTKNTFLEICEDQEGNVWFGSYEGLYCLENNQPGQLYLSCYLNNPIDSMSISGNRLLALAIDQDNNLWVGAENGGLYLFNRKEKNFWHFHTDDYDQGSLNNESIQDIYFDDCGNMWIGTFGGGVNLFAANSGAIQHYRRLRGGGESLSSNEVSAFCQDSDSRIWIGTDGGGLNLFHKKTNRFSNFNTQNTNLSSNVILSIVEDQKDQLWMGTWGGGIICFDPAKRICTNYTKRNSQIQDDHIFAVEKGYDGDLWLGSYRNGLIHFEPQRKFFTSYNQENSGISNNYVYVVKKDGKGNLIFGTTSGLGIFHPATQTFTSFTSDPSNPVSLSHNTIYDILVENDTAVWIGTQAGLNRFNPLTGTFRRFYTSDGLPDNVVKGLVFDNNHQLWVTTNGGICRFDYGHEILIYTPADGLQSNEFKAKSTLRSNSGELYLGGVYGFNIISPGKIKKNTHVPEIVLTGLQIFNKDVKPGQVGSPLKNIISDTEEIKLNYDQNHLTFMFAALDYTSPKRNQYQYKLNNFDDGWIHSGNKSEVTYSNLDPGRYTFYIKGSNNDGVWNEEGAKLDIIIRPPWWLQLWFKILVAFILVFGITLIFYLRTARLKQQKEVLAMMVEEKTNDLIQINATKDKLFAIIAHDLKNPFNIILGYADLIITKFDAWSDKEKLEMLSLLRDASEKAYNLLENLLNWSQSQRGTLKFEMENLNTADILNHSFQDVCSFAEKKGVTVRQDAETEQTIVIGDKNMLQLVCRNLLLNAIKFSYAGTEIKCSIKSLDNSTALFSIKDSGIGMTEEKVKTLFNVKENQSTLGTSGEKGTGLGLVLCHDFIVKHGGKIWVESKPGDGATFFFTVPKARV